MFSAWNKSIYRLALIENERVESTVRANKEIADRSVKATAAASKLKDVEGVSSLAEQARQPPLPVPSNPYLSLFTRELTDPKLIRLSDIYNARNGCCNPNWPLYAAQPKSEMYINAMNILDAMPDGEEAGEALCALLHM
jgi:hypothetical protein